MFSGLSIRTTIYDIFGYLMPGMLLLAICHLGYALYAGEFNTPLPTSVIGIFGITFVSYALGHAVNAASKIVIEEWLFRKQFLEAANWQKREKNELRLKRLEDRARLIFNMGLADLTRFELHIRCEEKLSQSFTTGFTFLSFYGMSRSLAFLCILTIPIGFYFAWLLSANIECLPGRIALSALGSIPSILLAFLFHLQYLRFAQNYYDYLASSLLIDTE